MTTSRNGAQSLVAYAEEKLAALADKRLTRRLVPTRRGEAARAARDGAALISFCDNDYLGLSQDPRVKKAAAEAALEYGAGAGASRLVTGDCPLYGALEERLARMKGTEAALVFGSGYLANVSAIPVLVRPGDRALLDERSHACMFAGARLSGAHVETFRHNDAGDLARRLAAARSPRALVLTETVFSMDGDRAPLDAIAAACEEAGAWLMTDDAHGLGVVPGDNPAPVQMGTLSKAAGAYGGYVCGPRALIELLVNRARGLVFTTGLPPAALGASIAALDIMAREPERGAKARANAALFCRLIDAPAPESAIVPVILGDPEAALAASQRLSEAGFLVAAIRPPSVPEGTARLRVAFSAVHQAADIERLAAHVRAILREAGR
ncbi:aminotransferase class I/II-fold pyridoxal phosphate-dependent enzyme [Amphiplicatus metriothermophilus]|uniref:8-amino-7-oxononanoate synthase n=1 Tax=Amphiplicatus metriothermophilus TaxID=1519374 RepID=A0A239PVZ9_9PROT|nr:8-amino-7-oxononanoate synthase [Amphiplicatus metriothermophilus]MBB5519640.1 8-amino-7-oxononanoate synthase [Amphiplicatus metriothermophilus]SNT74203.1 8-amino-7-oxononanoate synthase [Amphiplicatus metriothermophilus]